MASFWELPGPRRFILSVVDDLRGGSSVVLRFGSSCPRGLLDELPRHCRWASWDSVDAGSASRPLFAIRASLGGGKESEAIHSELDFARAEHYQGRIIWVNDIPPSAWPTWNSFLRTYSDVSRNHVPVDRRTAFVVPLCGDGFGEDGPSEVAMTRRKFRDIVHRDDLYVLALQHSHQRPRRRIIQSLRAHTVAHVAHWDHDLAERLLEADVHVALQPQALLRAYAQERGWTAETPEEWEAGTVDGPKTRPIVHSALLAVQGREAELSRRLWAAQAAVLMPLLEERRVEIIDRHRNHFDLPFETDLGRFEKPEDFELGLMVYYFHRHGAPNGKTMGDAVRLKKFRNKLAHIQPLAPGEALHPVLLGA